MLMYPINTVTMVILFIFLISIILKPIDPRNHFSNLSTGTATQIHQYFWNRESSFVFPTAFPFETCSQYVPLYFGVPISFSRADHLYSFSKEHYGEHYVKLFYISTSDSDVI